MSATTAGRQPTYPYPPEQLAAERRHLGELFDALAEAGVVPTAEEVQVLRWLAIWSDDKSAVVAALIRRAHHTGALADTH